MPYLTQAGAQIEFGVGNLPGGVTGADFLKAREATVFLPPGPRPNNIPIRNSMRAAIVLLLGGFLTACLLDSASAETYSWWGYYGADWSHSPKNWQSGSATVPGADDDVLFGLVNTPSNYTNSNINYANARVKSLTLSLNGVGVYGQALAVRDAINSYSTTATIGCDLALSYEDLGFGDVLETHFNVTPGSVLTLAGTVSGSEALKKRNKGTLVLTHSNSYTGGTRV